MSNPDRIVIEMHLKKALSLDEFRGANKLRIMNKPYFTLMADGTIWPDFIKPGTDVTELQEGIAAGRVYVRNVIDRKG